MHAFALFARPQLTKPAMFRALAAGAAWGLLLTAGFAAIAWRDCGVICLDDIAVTGVTSMGVGILTIGPLVVLGAARGCE